MKNTTFGLIFFVLLSTALLTSNQAIFAGTTGKIAGKVVDAESREPLPGTNVILAGTTMGGATDLQGNYVILNIPPGIYTVRMAMMGYKTQVIENVQVKIDLTTTVDAGLQVTVLDAGEEVTVVAERPLVQLDMTSSLSSVSASEIEALPVQDIGDVLELQAGIVKTGNDLHIRGGRAGEVAYWVDGVAATDVFAGGMGVTVENSAVQELQVISGTFNAEYGNAMSGIINIITKEGGRRYTGQLRAYVGDYVSGGDEFSVLKSIDTVTDPETGAFRTIGEKEYPLEKFNPNYDADFSLSGPVPFLGKSVTFFANGRYVYNEGHLYGREWFTPQGNPGDSSLVPMNPYTRYTTQGKITYKPMANMKLSYNIFWNSWNSDRSYNQNYKYNPDGVPKGMGGGTTHIFALNHVLSPKTFYELRINRFYNQYKQYVYEDPYATSKYLVWVFPDSVAGVEGHQLDPSIPEDAAALELIKDQRLRFTYTIDPNGPKGYVHPDSAVAPVSYSFFNVGMNMDHYSRSTAYWTGKLDLSSQITPLHQIKTGVEVKMHELELNSYSLRPKVDEGSNEQIVPFEPDIPGIETVYRSEYLRKPREFSVYVQDKIELKDLIVNFGLRFDYFDANSVMPTDPSDPSIYTPFKNKNKYKNWVDPSEKLSPPEMEAYINQFEEYTPEERRAFMHKKVDSKTQLSPRLGLAYPITDRGVIHFSYGHFFQIPDFQHLYSNPDFKVSPSGGETIFGNADLHAQKTVQYEIGLQQQVTGTIGIDATLFYRDVRDWVGTSPFIDTPIPSVRYSQYENKDYMNVRGITLKFEKRYANNFSARVDYTFQIVEGTYSNPNDAFNALQAQEEPRLALIPLNWDQNHTVNGSIIYQLKSWTVSLIGRYWSGRPYTPSFARGEVIGGAAYIGLRENSERLPAQRSVDLYIDKRFQLGGMDLHLFMNVYNLTDQRDETAVYGDTGTAEYTTNIDPNTVGYNANRVGTVEDYVLQPGWYTTPRQIQVGVALGF